MKMAKPIVLTLLAAALVSVPARGQGFYLGLRGGAGIPTGDFSNTGSSATAVDAAKSGFGYGVDAGLSLGFIGVYAGFDHIKFDCESNTCDSDGKYSLQGLAAGLRLSLPGSSLVHPWVKGGVTFNELKGEFGTSSQGLSTDRNPGYEIAAGLDIPLLRIFSLYPQARYVGQNLKYDIPGVTNNATSPEAKANYMTFDLGLSFHNPVGGKK
ncbi:MAG TPA: outer membrane beta-barrel protein [Gemmatimonadaceae bacterium]|nr:outer membrane beta-barrel protein [Gemmatimonadaceae bacterium]